MNIVLIMADQLAAGFLGCYGSGVDSTPTLDRLAERGVRFDRCYATCPVCAPNRATMFTGRSPVVHGLISNNFTLQTDMPTFAHMLRSRGFRTGGFGKFHLTPMPMAHPADFEYLGFDEAVITEDPKLGAYLDWIAAEHPEHYRTALAMSWPIPWIHEYGPDKRDLEPEWRKARQEILDPLEEASRWCLMYPSPLPAELHQTAFITDQALDFMARHSDDGSERPFFCFVSYVDPHDPYDPPAPYARMFDDADMPGPLPPGWDRERNAILDQSRDELRDFRTICDDPRAIARLRALYHGSVRFIDDQIARIVAFLDDRNLWDDTILVFTTDHGDMMGDHELLTKGVKHFDKGIRCPLIVCGRGIEAAVTDRLSCTLDFFPTLCDWAGVADALRPPLEGKSFAPVAEGGTEEDSWEEVLVAFGPVSSVITADGWRLTVYNSNDPGEMFNLREDPDEQNNLYDDPGWSEKRRELTERLVRCFIEQGECQQYRNLPAKDGKKWLVGGPGNGSLVRGLPLYDLPPKAPYS